MSVVLRCLNCGTTQIGSGECEACHETHVRYFCTNHVPGVWLKTDMCPQCGIAPSAPARVASPPRSAPRERPPTPIPKSSPAALRPAITRGSSRRSAKPVIDVETRKSRPLRDEEVELSELTPTRSILAAILDARAKAARSGDARPMGIAVAGCLRRAIMTVLLLAVALGLAVFLFGRVLLQALQP